MRFPNICQGCVHRIGAEVRRDGQCVYVYGPVLDQQRHQYRLKGIKVARRADSGFVGKSGNGFLYKPIRGFIGADEFSVWFRFVNSKNKPTATTLHVNIAVR